MCLEKQEEIERVRASKRESLWDPTLFDFYSKSLNHVIQLILFVTYASLTWVLSFETVKDPE